MSTPRPLLLAILGLGGAALAVTVPNPRTTEHPGAEAAPASSPLTYPDEEGFAARSRIVLEGVADNDLMTWRRGYFTGGDPGKYLPGHAMAKLLIGQDDPNIVRLFNDDRSVREHYHFAALNWARFLPLYGESILTPEKRTELAERAERYDAYLQGGGTENHVTQWRAAANVLPHYLEGGRLARRDKERALREAKAWLRNYVRGIYAAGNGEWDSSTYYKFTMHGLLNIYDFSPDPETRLLAKAGLDWFTTAYALKYRDGVFTAPNQRGFASGAHRTISDETGFIWWGSNAEITPADTRGWRYTPHAITSGWRPNIVHTRLARKDLPSLEQGGVEFRNSKPNYWGTTGTPRPSQMHETVFQSRSFTMGTLWNGHGSQITRFMVAADSPEGGVVLTGGNPRQSDHRGQKTGIGFRDGNGRYTQFASLHDVAVSMSLAPDDDTDAHYSFLSFPEGVTPVADGNWWVLPLGNARVAIYPLGGAAEVARTPEDRRGRSQPMLRIPGVRTGFVVHVTEADADTPRPQVDASRFERDLSVTVATSAGPLQMTFNPAEGDDRHGNQRPHVVRNGEAVEYGNWPVYDGPYIQQANGVLTVNDGRQGFVVDFTGDLPVYRDWTP